MFNPAAFFNPQQMEELAKMQQFTRDIKYVIHTEDGHNRIEVTLVTDNAESAKLVPQIREVFVQTVTQLFYQMFAMNGERI